jgi:hypothetical protein
MRFWTLITIDAHALMVEKLYCKQGMWVRFRQICIFFIYNGPHEKERKNK